MADEREKRRVLILGGGLGGLAAAYKLSETAALQERYEVTVIQMGWRLGGKGASGRGVHGRIEEHGLHLLFGFYDNTFAILRELYAALGRAPGTPLADWREAFCEQSEIWAFHEFEGRMAPWSQRYRRRDGLPGDARPRMSPWAAIRELVHDCAAWLRSGPLASLAECDDDDSLLGCLDDALISVGASITSLAGTAVASLAEMIAEIVDRLDDAGGANRESLVALLFGLLDRLRRSLWLAVGGSVDTDLDAHRAWVFVDLVAAVVRGVLTDGLLERRGWRRVDDIDFRAWLRKHGADEVTLASPRVGAIYSAVLIGPRRGNLEIGAGTALYTLYRILYTYRGSILWRMAAGMGDAVFVPFYEVLRARGVRFEFFSQVTGIEVDEAGRRAVRVHVARQIALRDGVEEYEPLIEVAGLRVWPARPLHAQLAGGEALAASGANLESCASGWPPACRRELVVDRDFDDVVLALPIGALPSAAGELVRRFPTWATMVARVQTIETQSFQLWLRDDLAALGWPHRDTFAISYVEPADTWVDMSSVLPRETWPEDHAPRSVVYFTGYLDGPVPASRVVDAAHRADTTAKARATVQEYVERHLGSLWPGGAEPRRPGALARSRLLAGREPTVADGIDAQYFRANVDPWERYVLSAPGTNLHRIGPSTELDNLVVAGDWTDNGLYCGSTEGAVVSGIMAAAALGSGSAPIAGSDAW